MLPKRKQVHWVNCCTVFGKWPELLMPTTPRAPSLLCIRSASIMTNGLSAKQLPPRRVLFATAPCFTHPFHAAAEHDVPDELRNQYCQLATLERTLVFRFATAIHVLLELYDRLTIAQATHIPRGLG